MCFAYAVIGFMKNLILKTKKGRPRLLPQLISMIGNWPDRARQKHAALRPIAFSAFNGSFGAPSDGDGAVTLPLPLLFQTKSFIPPLDRTVAVPILMNSCSYV